MIGKLYLSQFKWQQAEFSSHEPIELLIAVSMETRRAEHLSYKQKDKILSKKERWKRTKGTELERTEF